MNGNIECGQRGHGPPGPFITAGLKQLSPDILRQVGFDSLAAGLDLFRRGPLSSSRYQDQVLVSNIFTVAINQIEGIEMGSSGRLFFFFFLHFFLSCISVDERDSRRREPGWPSVCAAVCFWWSQDIHCVSPGKQPVQETITSFTMLKSHMQKTIMTLSQEEKSLLSVNAES